MRSLRSAACRRTGRSCVRALPSERATPFLGYAAAGAEGEHDLPDELANRPADGPLARRRVGGVAAGDHGSELRRRGSTREREDDGREVDAAHAHELEEVPRGVEAEVVAD